MAEHQEIESYGKINGCCGSERDPPLLLSTGDSSDRNRITPVHASWGADACFSTDGHLSVTESKA